LPVLVDGLGAAQTGLFLFATTLTGYFTAIDLSLGASVTRYVAEYRVAGATEKIASTVRSALGMRSSTA